MALISGTYLPSAQTAYSFSGKRIMLVCLIATLGCFSSALFAQFTGNVSVYGNYSDNAFQLSDYDLARYDDNHHLLDFVKTTDDINLGTQIELGYPLFYRWWKFTPSVVANINQNVSNTNKYRRDATIKLRVDRYYWNLTARYQYQPHIYFRDFNDGDGTDQLENYAYSRNTARADLAVRPTRTTTLKANIRTEDYRYNEFFTEADGQAITGGLGVAHRFPTFTIDAGLDYRTYENDNRVNDADASYDANIYYAKLTMPRMPVSDKGKVTWQPSLGINYQEKFFQGGGSWYGGRADYTYTMSAGFNWFFNPNTNLSLDYTHVFRSVESNNSSVVRLKEYSENKFGASLNYKF